MYDPHMGNLKKQYGYASINIHNPIWDRGNYRLGS